MRNYIKGWNFMRLLRLAIGIFIIVQGIMMGEWMLAVLGVLFSIMPVLNVGCGGVAGSCNRPFSQSYKTNRLSEDISYEEVK